MIKEKIKKFFLVKEIRSKEGELHFQRYRLLSSRWLRVYIHKICKSDEDSHLHTHPWSFFSFILKGGYKQKVMAHPLDYIPWDIEEYNRFDLIHMSRYEGHKITLTQSPTWTFVISYGSRGPWGYLTSEGFIDHKRYRQLKNEGKLPK